MRAAKEWQFMHKDADDIHSTCSRQGAVRTAGALSAGDMESMLPVESMITITAFVAECYSSHKLATNASRSRTKYWNWDTKQTKQNREITEHLL